MSEERALEFLLAFDGRIHHLEQGYRLKFEIRRIAAIPEQPHGLRYSFTLHGPARSTGRTASDWWISTTPMGFGQRVRAAANRR